MIVLAEKGNYYKEGPSYAVYDTEFIWLEVEMKTCSAKKEITF